MSNRVVLDASAVLALLYREPGHQLVEQLIETCEAMISAVNVSEVLAKQEELLVPAESTLKYLNMLGIKIVPFEVDAAVHTASLRIQTRAQGLSLGDRACIALGRQSGCPVVTADRAWIDADTGLQIIAIR